MEIYHIMRGDERLCTFYDRRWLGDMIKNMFPLGAHGDCIVQADDQDGTVQLMCSVNDAVHKGREWLMRRPTIAQLTD